MPIFVNVLAGEHAADARTLLVTSDHDVVRAVTEALLAKLDALAIPPPTLHLLRSETFANAEPKSE